MNLYFKWIVGSDNKTTQFALGFNTILTDDAYRQGIQGVYPKPKDK